MSNRLRIHKYNATWPKEFNKLKDHLSNILSNHITDIIHVGSTSVQGMYAKPILDIDLVYESNFKEIRVILENNNYQFEGDKGIKDRYSFKYQKTDFYEHHLYVIKANSIPLLEHLALKKALLNNHTYRKMYSDLKRKLISENNIDRELYTESKTDLIKKIISEE